MESGNTIRLKCNFKTFAGVDSDPESITLKIYNKYRKQIGNTISITNTNKVSTGNYQYDYTVPSGYDQIIYEYSGTLEGSTITARDAIDVSWVD